MSPQICECVIFVGPTAYGLDAAIFSDKLKFCRLPPVQRGDIDRLAAAHPTGVIAIVDGMFHQSLAVGHAEIRRAIEKGWQVWGLSSMGAIRAYEMRTLGMRGFGRTYQRFLQEDDFRDDEVAMLHEPAPSYRPCSEPLIHIRVGIQDLTKREVLSQSDAQGVIQRLENLWFGDRTLGLVRKMLLERLGEAHRETIAEWVATIDRHRLKTADLKDFLHERPWENPILER